MVKIDINREELEALDKVLKKVECPISTGLIIGMWRVKIQQELLKEQEKVIKEKYAPKKKR